MIAEGASNLQMALVAEEVRVPGVRVSEAGRVQQLRGMGNAIKLQMKETREQGNIDYQRDKIAALTGAVNKSKTASTNAVTGMLGSLGSGLIKGAMC